MSSIIYKFFENSNIINSKDPENISWLCKECKRPVKARNKTSSNLIGHLDRIDHKIVREKYEKDKKENDMLHDANQSVKKRKLFFENKITQSHLSSVGITMAKSSFTLKYPKSSQVQRLHYESMISMLVKCMLPVSIVENPG